VLKNLGSSTRNAEILAELIGVFTTEAPPKASVSG